MQNWMDGITHVPRGGGIPIPGDENVVVWHSTETNGPASYNGSEPHWEVYGGDEVSDEEAIRQFVPLDSSSKALWNEPGGVETNRRSGHIIQIELVWHAADAANMPDTLLRRAAMVARFIESQMVVPRAAPPQGWWMPGTIAVVNSPLRFSYGAWAGTATNRPYAGHCAHVNVPENDHWDVGPWPWERFLTFLAPEGELTMAQVEDINAKLDTLLSKDQFANDVLTRMVQLFGPLNDAYGDAESFSLFFQGLALSVAGTTSAVEQLRAEVRAIRPGGLTATEVAAVVKAELAKLRLGSV